MVLLLLVAQDKGDETEGTLERPLKCPLDMSISYTEKENFISVKVIKQVRLYTRLKQDMFLHNFFLHRSII